MGSGGLTSSHLSSGKGKGETSCGQKVKGKVERHRIHPDLTTHTGCAYACTTGNETISRLSSHPPTSDEVPNIFSKLHAPVDHADPMMTQSDERRLNQQREIPINREKYQSTERRPNQLREDPINKQKYQPTKRRPNRQRQVTPNRKKYQSTERNTEEQGETPTNKEKT